MAKALYDNALSTVSKVKETMSPHNKAAHYLSPDFLGANLWTDDKMRAAVPSVMGKFEEARSTGAQLSKGDKDAIAKALMDWAIKRGAVNFSHWFSPMRGTCAQKHDAFIDLDFSSPSHVKPFKKDFDGGKLFMAETDGSSFPNGGLRQTHTAAAFNSWDMKSPPFVRGETLYIPSCFVAWNGMALDEKTPLLRSMEALSREGVRMLKNLGEDEFTEVRCFVGWEQEFFVVSKENFMKRPDLMATGRSVLGAPPTKGQQEELHYFGQIPGSVARYLEDVQKEMWLLGSPMLVYHNEVAPGQHELSPIFQVSNHSVDTNAYCMEIMKEIADKHGLAVLFHEKPFAGVNGNGKHNNWSVQGFGHGVSCNLMKTGKKEKDQVRYTVATACLAKAIHMHGDVVRCACIGAGNDHRLGAQEAPPAIMSLYPGIGMEAHMKAVVSGGPLDGYTGESKPLSYGASAVQNVAVAAEDRNRTAPFPSCGNRFEFRAVGGAQNLAHPNVMINTALADAMRIWSELVEGGMDIRDATAQILKDAMKAVFTGNGYSKEWPIEAVNKRKLKNLHNTVTALDQFASDKNKEMFERMGVYLPEEVEARANVMFEKYALVIGIEAATMVSMVNTGIIPACAKDLKTYAGTSLAGPREATYAAVQDTVSALEAALAAVPHGSEQQEAHYMCEKVFPAMDACRKACDAAEVLMEASLYPFPTYHQLMYSHH